MNSSESSHDGNSGKAQFSQEEIQFLKEAAQFFDDPGYVMEGMNWLARPITYAESKLPEVVRNEIARVSRSAVEQALKLAIRTIPDQALDHSFETAQKRSRLTGAFHTGAATLVGGLGGFLGLLSLPLELPVTTTIMLRSIAEIARQNGSDLSSIEGRLECLYVFCLGTRSTQDDHLDTTYYASRIAFAEVFKGASAFIAAHTTQDILLAIEKGTAPSLVRFISQIAAQFEIRVTKKLLAQATPVIGAAGGAALNLLFTRYYNACAKFHFGLVKLEKLHGYEETQTLFNSFRRLGDRHGT